MIALHGLAILDHPDQRQHGLGEGPGDDAISIEIQIAREAIDAPAHRITALSARE